VEAVMALANLGLAGEETVKRVPATAQGQADSSSNER
jgi:hypothetical protein